jgi:hypothetical protein
MIRRRVLGRRAELDPFVTEPAHDPAVDHRLEHSAARLVAHAMMQLACVYALGNMASEAIDCLHKAIENGFGHREWLDNDSDLDSLRSDPHFQPVRHNRRRS